LPYGLGSHRVDEEERTGEYATPLAVAKVTGSRLKNQSGYFIATPCICQNVLYSVCRILRETAFFLPYMPIQNVSISAVAGKPENMQLMYRYFCGM
jgi:hypothetical protein